MRVRHLPFVLVFLMAVLVPGIASADGHRAGLFGGYSVARGSTLSGGRISYERTWVDGDKKYIYGSVDYSFHVGDDLTRQILLFSGDSPFVQVGPVSAGGRFGFGWIWDDGKANFGGVAGGFIDIGKYSPSVHATQTRFELRLAFEEIFREGLPEKFERYSIGLVVKWPK